MQKRTELYLGGIKSHKECKKLASEMVERTFDELVDSALDDRTDFAYEGHFTNDATWDTPLRFRNAGYDVHLIFFGLSDPDLSYTRVVGRAKEGGHYVDPLTVESNFYGNLEKLDKYFPMFHSVTLFDPSGLEHIGLAVLQNGVPTSAVETVQLPDWFTQNLPRITALISDWKTT